MLQRMPRDKNRRIPRDCNRDTLNDAPCILNTHCGTAIVILLLTPLVLFGTPTAGYPVFVLPRQPLSHAPIVSEAIVAQSVFRSVAVTECLFIDCCWLITLRGLGS